MSNHHLQSEDIPGRMSAAVFRNGEVSLASIPTPVPTPEEALLRVRMSGICQTDLELLRGYQDFYGVPGHEFVAEVVSAPGQSDLEGSRVVADINIGCGQCPYCLRREQNHCPNRSVLGIRGRQGAFAEYLAAPLSHLHPLPEKIPDRRAVFAEPLAAALRVTQQIHIRADMHVAVLGDGKLGLLAAMGLRHFNPGVVLAGRHPDKLEIFNRLGGRTRKVDPEGTLEDGEEWMRDLDLVVEATGNPQGLEQARRMCKPQGTVVLKTTSASSTCLSLSPITVNEQRILGSRCGDLDQAIHFLQQDLVQVDLLIEAVRPLSDIRDALHLASERGRAKILVNNRE